jgi:hypothetical protein
LRRVISMPCALKNNSFVLTRDGSSIDRGIVPEMRMIRYG